jgi:decaprenylphospho-beta-D-erythro-pentofuranosid-2-ulose 2-reductase
LNDAFGLPQSVLVLGGGSAIARATVSALVRQGTRRVVLAGRSSSVEQAAAEARAAGATSVEVVEWDARDVGRHQETLGPLFGAAGDIDLVLVAAGVLGEQSSDEHDPLAAAEVITTNFTGPATACLVVADGLRSQGHGTLVVLSSVAGERVRRSNFVYGASKAGLDSFCQALDDALVGSGARVMVVRPGFVHTPMTAGLPAAPFSATAEQVAEAIVNGLRRRRHLVWVPAPLRAVMMVYRHLPRPLARRVPA